MSASLAPECNEVKEYELNLFGWQTATDSYRKYDNCFLKWYSESTLHIVTLVDLAN
jgi:hypothetical protein